MYTAIPIETIRALNDHVLVTDMNFGTRTTSSGLFLLNDDMRTAGIRPRWAQVYAIGPAQEDISIGDWVLVSHGRWTRGVDIEDDDGKKTLRRIDPTDILLVSDEEPSDDSMSTSILKDSPDRW
jgi:co-chaperonin GroES (HSP10)